MTFPQIGVSETLSEFLAKKGIETPTPVQERAIPLASSGKDILVSAQTGTGKTYAYSLPLLSKLSENPGMNLLVLVPTRELAQQVGDVIAEVNRLLKLPAPAVLVGGLSFGSQASRLRQKPRVVIATPGRLMDHLRQRTTKLNDFCFLVLDEADRMLDMGFLPQVKEICKALPSDRQTLLFTATISASEKRKMLEFLRDPEQVFVDPPSTMATTIEQRMEEVTSDEKVDRLIDVLANMATSALVFVRTKRRADRVADSLQKAGIDCDVLHGDRSQAQRQKAVQRFRQEDVRVLVATDVASRGLDIPAVGMVLNLDPPETREDLVHRNGRTGRAGAKGESVTFIAPEEMPQWKYLKGEKADPMPRGPRKRNQRDNFGRHPVGATDDRRASRREKPSFQRDRDNFSFQDRPHRSNDRYRERRDPRVGDEGRLDRGADRRPPSKESRAPRAAGQRSGRGFDPRPPFRSQRGPRFSNERREGGAPGFEREQRSNSYARDRSPRTDDRGDRAPRDRNFGGPRTDRFAGRGDRPQRTRPEGGPRFGDKPRFVSSRDRSEGAPKKSRFRRFGAEPVSANRG